jgi:hypothetical protein
MNSAIKKLMLSLAAASTFVASDIVVAQSNSSTIRVYGSTDVSACVASPAPVKPVFSELQLKCVANIQDGLEYAVYGLGFTTREAYARNNTTGQVEPVQSGFGFLYQNQYGDHESSRNFCQKYLEAHGCSNIRVEDYMFQGDIYLPGYYRSGSNCQVDLSSCTPSDTDMLGNPIPPGQKLNLCALGLF